MKVLHLLVEKQEFTIIYYFNEAMELSPSF